MLLRSYSEALSESKENKIIDIKTWCKRSSPTRQLSLMSFLQRSSNS